MKQKMATYAGLNPKTTCTWVQYATTDQGIIVLKCSKFTLLKEDTKTTWFIELQIKVGLNIMHFLPWTHFL